MKSKINIFRGWLYLIGTFTYTSVGWYCFFAFTNSLSQVDMFFMIFPGALLWLPLLVGIPLGGFMEAHDNFTGKQTLDYSNRRYC